MNDREKFEKHIKEVLGFCIDIGVDGEYESDKTRENWLTWQVATAQSAARMIQIYSEAVHKYIQTITNTGDKTDA